MSNLDISYKKQIPPKLGILYFLEEVTTLRLLIEDFPLSMQLLCI